MTLLLKLSLAPLLVVASSLAGRRWGAQVSGVLVALPIVAGPILLITCLDHGPTFGTRAAGASLLGLISLALFVAVFGRAAQRLRWPAALALAWAACLAADVVLARLTVPPLLAAPLVLASAWLAARALPLPEPAEFEPVESEPAEFEPALVNEAPTASMAAAMEGTSPESAVARGPVAESGGAVVRQPPWWDLPARAVATAVLVLTVTGAAEAIGPAATGVLAPFPIATSVVAAFALARDGAGGAVRMLRGVPGGLVGFTVFCLAVALLVERAGTYAAFGLALVITLAVQAAALVFAARRRPATA
ncbi:hypothetical protein ACQP00_35120 [Dactylosporangium sp. CS-047395]|uniref:hypothetical protein n=1 Tax=Dactylosporangium sp. CS-047395 TaxID=3239936 RepID=UPI003D948D95